MPRQFRFVISYIQPAKNIIHMEQNSIFVLILSTSLSLSSCLTLPSLFSHPYWRCMRDGLVSCEEKDYYRVALPRQLRFDCHPYCGRGRCMQGIHMMHQLHHTFLLTARAVKETVSQQTMESSFFISIIDILYDAISCNSLIHYLLSNGRSHLAQGF